MAQQQGGMFGPTPEELQYALSQQQQDEDFRNADSWGNKSLAQQISAGAYASGMGIGRSLQNIGQATGYIPQDPRLAEAQKMMQIKKNIMESGIDPQDIDKFYPEMINQLYKGGMIDKAIELEKQYQGASSRQAEVDVRIAAANAAAEKARLDLEKDRALKAAVSGRAAFVKRKNPELTEEEALGIANDASVFNKFTEDKKRDTIVTAAGGRRLLVYKDNGELIKDLGAAGKTLEEVMGTGLGALGSAMGAAIAGTTAKKTGEAQGTAVGKDVAAIQGKYDALSAVTDALAFLDKGIYSGKFGPAQEAVAGYTRGGVGDLNRVANTEQFRSAIGNVVIPRLQEFGGNDSVEELKYLQKVMAGETNLESKAIKGILKSAERKIQRGIQRLKDQQKAAYEGRPLPTGPTKTTKGTTSTGTTYEVMEDD